MFRSIRFYGTTLLSGTGLVIVVILNLHPVIVVMATVAASLALLCDDSDHKRYQKHLRSVLDESNLMFKLDRLLSNNIALREEIKELRRHWVQAAHARAMDLYRKD